MAQVKKVCRDVYEVSNFLHSMPDVRMQVGFTDSNARVTDRSGTTETVWDRQAIQAVQFVLVSGNVKS